MRTGILVWLGLLLATSAAAAGAGNQGTQTVSGEPVLVYSRWSDELADADRTPLLRVYADGTVLLHRPRHWRDPGDYPVRLPAAEVRALLIELHAQGLARLDPVDVAADHERAEQAQQRQSATRWVDSETAFSEIRVDWSGTIDAAQAPLRNHLVYANLQIVAARYPQVASLVRLAAAERTLIALYDRLDPTRHESARQEPSP
jgi:hypothetical protein